MRPLRCFKYRTFASPGLTLHALHLSELIMLDLFYLAGTIAFFGLMLAYVSFCDRLGRSDANDASKPEARP